MILRRAVCALLVAVAALMLTPAAFAQVSFSAPTSFPVGDAPTGLASGDFDADDDPDLAAALTADSTEGNRVGVSLGGSGVDFKTGAGGAGQCQPDSVATGDFNGDSDLDYVAGSGFCFDIAAGFTSGMSIVLGAAESPSCGSAVCFAKPDEIRFSEFSFVTDVAVGEFNEDGDPDIVAVDNGTGTASVFLGGSGGDFGARKDYAVGDGPSKVGIGDFNRDGDPDLAVTNTIGDTVSVMLGQPGGDFGTKTDLLVGDPRGDDGRHRPYSIAVDDFDGDSNLDLAIALAGFSGEFSPNDNVAVMIGDGKGGFGSPSYLPVLNDPREIVATDLNGDGDPDLAVTHANFFTPRTSVLLGQSGGGFGPKTDFETGPGEGLVAGDFDGDRDDDLALARPNEDAISVLRNTTTPPASSLCDFQGGDGGSWHAAGNWSCNKVPDAEDDVAITGRSVAVASDARAGRLAVRDGASIVFSNAAKLDVAGAMEATNGILSGSGTVRVAGTFSKSGAGRLALTNDGARGSPDLILEGTGSIDGGSICVARNGDQDPDLPKLEITRRFTIDPGADATAIACSGTQVHLSGRDAHLVKTSDGTTSVSGAIDNDGRMTVERGRLLLARGTAGATSAGAYRAESGAAIQFGTCCGEPFAIGGTGSVGGPGTITVSADVTLAAGAALDPGVLEHGLGTLTLEGTAPVDLPALSLTGGVIDSDRPIGVTDMTVTHGSLSSDFVMTVRQGGSFLKTGDGPLHITNNGAHGSPDLVLNEDAVMEAGSMCVSRTGDQDPDLPSLQINQRFTIGVAARSSAFGCDAPSARVHVNGPDGELVRDGVGTTRIEGGVATSGTVRVADGQTIYADRFAQSGGTTSIAAGGTLDAAPALTGGALEGAGRVTGNLTNTAGFVRPGGSGATGTLTLDGSYSQGAAGTLAVEIGAAQPADPFDRLLVGGTVALNGTLDLTTLPGFDPVQEERFRIVATSTRSGSFSQITGDPRYRVFHETNGVFVDADNTPRTCTFTGPGLDWNGPNWDCAGGPFAADRVVIPSGRGPNLSTGTDGEAASIDLADGARLTVGGGRTLTVGDGASSFEGELIVNTDAKLVLGGDTDWTAGPWSVGGSTASTAGGAIENAGNLRIAGGLTLANRGGGQARNRVGATLSRASTGTSNPVAIEPPIDNDGRVDVPDGALRLDGGTGDGAASSGDFTVAGGATLSFKNRHVVDAGGSVTGDGSAVIAHGATESHALLIGSGAEYAVGETMMLGGFLDLAGTVAGTTDELTSVSGGGRDGAGTLAVGPHPVELTSFSFRGGGTTTFSPGAALSSSGQVNVQDAGTVVRLRGATEWDSGTWAIGGSSGATRAPGGTVENAGALDVTDDFDATDAGSGRIRNLAGAKVTSFESTDPRRTATFAPLFDNAGTVELATGSLEAPSYTQTAGSTSIAAGTSAVGAVSLQGGVLRGAGRVIGRVTNSGGTVEPGSSPGTLTVTGDYTQGAGGTLRTELDSDTAFDVLEVSGTATLGGTLAIARADAYEPVLGTTFPVLTATTRSGSFTATTGDSITSTRRLATRNEADGVRLEVARVDNDAPTAVLDAPDRVGEGRSFDLSGASSSDADGGRIVSYEWRVGSRPPVQTNESSLRVENLPPGTHTVSLVVTDDSGNESEPDSAQVEVLDLDLEAPTAILDAPEVVSHGDPVVLSGARSSDPGGGRVVRYVWRVGTRPPVETAESSLRVEGLALGRHRTSLVVVDASGNQSEPDLADVIVRDTERPTAVLDAPQSVAAGQAFRVSGARSSDTGGGRVVEHRFTVGNRPPIATRDSSIEVAGLPAGVHAVSLAVVDDSGNLSAAVTRQVVAVAPSAPRGPRPPTGTRLGSFGPAILIAPVGSTTPTIDITRGTLLAGRVFAPVATTVTATFTTRAPRRSSRKVAAAARRSQLRLGKKTLRVPAGGVRRLQVRLSKRVRRALRARKRVTVRVKMATREVATRKKATTTRTLRFRVKRRR